MTDGHSVPCPGCGVPFDPLAVEWCASRRGASTPCCPACGDCLCGLPPEAQRAFWRAEAAVSHAGIAEGELDPGIETHEIACLHCGDPYDAAIAAECGCTTAIRTPVCPHCRRCLCDEPMEVQIGFWAAAPEGMRRRTVSGL